MRELKLRIFDKKENRMLYSCELNSDFENAHSWFRLLEDLDYSGKDCNDNLSELMLYTGLKDKNVKEIYDSDIVAVEEDYQPPDGRIIKAGNYSIRYLCAEYGISQPRGWWPLADFDVEISPMFGVIRIKVIGNIYENFDLLK